MHIENKGVMGLGGGWDVKGLSTDINTGSC